jgi:hypothetical protein
MSLACRSQLQVSDREREQQGEKAAERGRGKVRGRALRVLKPTLRQDKRRQSTNGQVNARAGCLIDVTMNYQLGYVTARLWLLATARRTILALLLALLEFINLLLHSLVDATLQLRTVAEREQDLKPDKERGQEECLDQVVEQSRRPAFKLSMSNELCDPTGNIYPTSPVICRGSVRRGQMVAVRGTADENRREEASSNRLHEYVERRVQHCTSGADVQREVRHGEPCG